MTEVTEINPDIVYVRGITKGAIYNLNDGKVYSINSQACEILEEYIVTGNLSNTYLTRLKEMSLISDSFVPKEFAFVSPKKGLDFVWLELTEACNLHCCHCYEGDTHKDDPAQCLSFEEWKDVIRQLKSVGCKEIEFIGGEPTVYPHFFALLKFAVSLGHNMDIYSNLQAFDDKLLHVIKEHDIVIHFSIYGDTAVTHDAITRKQGSFSRLTYWVGTLIENKIRVRPSITIMRENQDNIQGIFTLLERMGIPKSQVAVDAVRATPMRSISGMCCIDKEKNLALRRKPNFSASKKFFNMARYVNTCLFGKFSIHPDGLVCPCEFSRDIAYGNVKSESISQILQSDTLDDLWFLDFSKISTCKSCEYRFACHDCRMLSGGGFHDKNPRCLYNPSIGEWDSVCD